MELQELGRKYSVCVLETETEKEERLGERKLNDSMSWFGQY